MEPEDHPAYKIRVVLDEEEKQSTGELCGKERRLEELVEQQSAKIAKLKKANKD